MIHKVVEIDLRDWTEEDREIVFAKAARRTNLALVVAFMIMDDKEEIVRVSQAMKNFLTSMEYRAGITFADYICLFHIADPFMSLEDLDVARAHFIAQRIRRFLPRLKPLGETLH